MEAFIPSTLAVAIAEIGDKTQLLTLFLAARFAQRNAIILGILVATLLNHGLSAWLGAWLVQWIPEQWVPWIIGASFIAVGLWVLIPDKDDEEDGAVLKYGAFIATCILFFIAEIGDKTQIATVILAARYDSLFWVIAGTTIGMMLANVPIAYAGSWLMQKIPLNLARWSACGLFVVLGILSIIVI
ncbi:MAG: TMEM165/GDT1 family protein [Oceanospirillales bacterium]|uniref:GDT1 family protein n=1 Tax=Marinobacterium halophilum TaxID=267374 RepID=A0A2P8EQL5_9GAMM|nr:TMEM165/GDT1 family protein [Marinobacterium halophilum]MBR9827116.1 TMEM165/GDT1 family protein [Oceanospirillales bacterium]PSL11734.1 putative Ca2+/H+ antiporter (TMEM165/GDT1 family) [Marinobacterium halophilum]